MGKTNIHSCANTDKVCEFAQMEEPNPQAIM